jgi:hypothetical protein
MQNETGKLSTGEMVWVCENVRVYFPYRKLLSKGKHNLLFQEWEEEHSSEEGSIK